MSGAYFYLASYTWQPVNRADCSFSRITGLCDEMNRTSRTRTMMINRRNSTSTWLFRFNCYFIRRCRLDVFFEPRKKNKNRGERSSNPDVARLVERREGNGTIEERFLFVDAFIKLLRLCQESRNVFRVGEVFFALHWMWNNIFKLQKFNWDVSIRGKDYSLIEMRKLAFTRVDATFCERKKSNYIHENSDDHLNPFPFEWVLRAL